MLLLILTAPALDDLDYAVSRAVQQGVTYAREHADLVAEEDAGFPGGAAGLLLYTLVQCGVQADDAVCLELATRASETIADENRTRALAHTILGLSAADAEAHRAALTAAVLRLAGSARAAGPEKGGFGQSVSAIGSPDAAAEPTDRISTPLVLFALRIAADHGIPVDRDVFSDGIDYLSAVQNRDGGFGHAESDRPDSRIIPTAGAAAAAVLAAEALPMDDAGRALRERASRIAQRAVKNLGDSLTLPPRDADEQPALALARLERLDWYVPGVLFDRSDDWRRDAARWLVAEQLSDGGFGDPAKARAKTGPSGGSAGTQGKKSRVRPRVEASLARTCYALLFLSRSTAKHGGDHENILRLTESYDPAGAREEEQRLERRIVAFGERAMAPLVVLLRRDTARAEFADKCLRRLTGKDVGYARARTEEDRRAAIDRWIDLYVGRG